MGRAGGLGARVPVRCRTLLATTLAQAGQAALAADLLAGIVAGRHPAYQLYAPDDLLARAWGAAAEGSTTEALGHAVAAADLAREVGAPADEVLAWQTAVQLGGATVALRRLNELAGLGPRAQLARTHARACVDEDGETLLETAEAWSRIGDLVAAGDEAAQAADAYRRQGRQGSASPPRRSPRNWPAGPAPGPGPGDRGQPSPADDREREIVVLAARGL